MCGSDTLTGVSDEEKPGGIKPVAWDVIVVVVVLVAAVVGTFVLSRLGAGSWADDPFLSVVSWVGAFVSLAGLLLAYLIFRRQARQSRAAEEANSLLMGRLHKLVVSVDRKLDDMVEKASAQVPDEEAEFGGDEPDRWEEDVPVSEVATDVPVIVRTANVEAHASLSADAVSVAAPEGAGDDPYVESRSSKRRIYDRLEIPLSVVGALVGQWRLQGHTGRWDIGSLVGGFRSVGKGNHPWFLVFRVPGSDRVEMWKVTRGPHDTDKAVRIKTPDNP